ncbi:MAG: CapA family protein [Treponema sp.]|nr:CapA family protein [Treponema sp.]
MKKKFVKKSQLFLAGIGVLFIVFTFFSCTSTPQQEVPHKEIVQEKEEVISEEAQKDSPMDSEAEVAPSTLSDNHESEPLDTTQIKNTKSEEIILVFGGDIMAHEENHRVLDYNEIWLDVKDFILSSDLAFGNLEGPMDQTKEISAYPFFNMPKSYGQAAINAGFNVFSLANNHSNDQRLSGIQETIKTMQELAEENQQTDENGSIKQQVFFSGLKQTPEENYSFNLIEKNGWKILFLPVTELLNQPAHAAYINYTKNTKDGRLALAEYCKKLREENPCDIFILSFHTSEPEYIRSYTKNQSSFYQSLLDAGVDVVWANHAHILKDRKIIFNTKNNTQKIIMYGNGNTISGQRRAPVLDQKNPNGERDNTGDGLLYKVIFSQKENEAVKIKFIEKLFITTYINTSGKFILKKLDDDFINYLYNIPRNDWALYITRRKNINEEYTRDLIEWQ